MKAAVHGHTPVTRHRIKKFVSFGVYRPVSPCPVEGSFVLPVESFLAL